MAYKFGIVRKTDWEIVLHESGNPDAFAGLILVLIIGLGMIHSFAPREWAATAALGGAEAWCVFLFLRACSHSTITVSSSDMTVLVIRVLWKLPSHRKVYLLNEVKQFSLITAPLIAWGGKGLQVEMLSGAKFFPNALVERKIFAG
jgi:hypothetical protein